MGCVQSNSKRKRRRRHYQKKTKRKLKQKRKLNVVAARTVSPPPRPNSCKRDPSDSSLRGLVSVFSQESSPTVFAATPELKGYVYNEYGVAISALHTTPKKSRKEGLIASHEIYLFSSTQDIPQILSM